MNFVTFEQMNDCLYRNLHRIPRDVDLIVGIPRSGMLPANLLALLLNLPFTDLDGLLSGHIMGTGTTRNRSGWITEIADARRILVVDDSISTGEAMKRARTRIAEVISGNRVLFAAIYALPTNVLTVDIAFEICNHPRMFEWNYMHHWGLQHSCVDIDGVLCEDPSLFQNDDGQRYAEFIRNALPKFLPTQRVACLVSGRLEKYRSETVEWLKRHGVAYDRLVLLDCADGMDRLRQGSIGAYKAEVYIKTDCFLFIESNYQQATEICRLSGKQVFCTENRKLIQPDNLQSHIKILANDWRITVKRVLRKLMKRLK